MDLPVSRKPCMLSACCPLSALQSSDLQEFGMREAVYRISLCWLLPDQVTI